MTDLSIYIIYLYIAFQTELPVIRGKDAKYRRRDI